MAEPTDTPATLTAEQISERARDIAQTWCKTPDDFYECSAAIEALVDMALRARAVEPPPAQDKPKDVREMVRFWPAPWRFEEEGYSGGPCVKAADGSVIATLFWPTHPPEETGAAEQATYALGRIIARLAAPAEPPLQGMDTAIDKMARWCSRMSDEARKASLEAGASNVGLARGAAEIAFRRAAEKARAFADEPPSVKRGGRR